MFSERLIIAFFESYVIRRTNTREESSRFRFQRGEPTPMKYRRRPALDFVSTRRSIFRLDAIQRCQQRSKPRVPFAVSRPTHRRDRAMTESRLNVELLSTRCPPSPISRAPPVKILNQRFKEKSSFRSRNPIVKSNCFVAI